jgi:polyphosphate kinase
MLKVPESKLKLDLEQTLHVYENDNCSAWDMKPNGRYKQRRPRKGQNRRAAQDVFIKLIDKQSKNKGKL